MATPESFEYRQSKWTNDETLLNEIVDIFGFDKMPTHVHAPLMGNGRVTELTYLRYIPYLIEISDKSFCTF